MQNGQRQADFIDVIAWRNTAEFICQHFCKGKLIAVQGSIQTRSYEDKNGYKHKVTELIAEKVSFCDDRGISAPKNKSEDETPEYFDIPYDFGEEFDAP